MCFEDLLTYHYGSMLLVADYLRRIATTIPRPEPGEINGAISSIGKSANGNALCFEILERTWNIEEALTAATNDGDWCSTELSQVGRNVQGVFAITMDTAQTARRKNLDAGQVSQDHGSCNGRAADELLVGAEEAGAAGVGQVSTGDLERLPFSG